MAQTLLLRLRAQTPVRLQEVVRALHGLLRRLLVVVLLFGHLGLVVVKRVVGCDVGLAVAVVKRQILR